MIFQNNLSNLTNYALIFATVVETVCAPTIIYLALYHSKQMKRYRYLIINTVFWSLLFDWITFFMKPQFTFPAACILYLNPLMAYGPAYLVGTALLMALFVNVEMAVVWSFMYRYLMAYPGRIGNAVESGKAAPRVMIIVQILVHFICFSPFTTVGLPGKYTAVDDAAFLQGLPQLFEKRNEFGHFCAVGVPTTRSIAYYGFVLLGCVFVVGIILYSILFHRVIIQKSKQFNMGSTQRMHLNVIADLQAVSAQLFIGYVMLLIPTAVLVYALYAEWEEGTTIVAVAVMFVQLHGCADFLAMIYFITPYRRKLMSVFREKSVIKNVRLSQISHSV
ncbi:unnamed protein product [Bursaphelenchus xylophilus]|uniref:(pine wood nematode) hypothetical protein n=1 Tax=Bursaphelenchus xylophilus TaxID=6326 RepID=A0A1I7RUQ1_BURXY|nr:unnamed protein product [Bursaphelenchus xylophilus]CAG9114311.1 unnamed protein product [Bursaphelenchus xylophilus]